MPHQKKREREKRKERPALETEAQVRSPGREDPWRRTRQPTPVFLPGESQGQRSLAGYSPQSHRASDTTKPLSTKHRFIYTN